MCGAEGRVVDICCVAGFGSKLNHVVHGTPFLHVAQNVGVCSNLPVLVQGRLADTRFWVLTNSP